MKFKRLCGISTLALSICLLSACSTGQKEKNILSNSGVLDYLVQRFDGAEKKPVSKLEKIYSGKIVEELNDELFVFENATDTHKYTLYTLQNGGKELYKFNEYDSIEDYDAFVNILVDSNGDGVDELTVIGYDGKVYLEAVDANFLYKGKEMINETISPLMDKYYETYKVEYHYLGKSSTTDEIFRGEDLYLYGILTEELDANGNVKSDYKTYTFDEYMDYIKKDKFASSSIKLDGAVINAKGIEISFNSIGNIEIYKNDKMIASIPVIGEYLASNGAILYQYTTPTNGKYDFVDSYGRKMELHTMSVDLKSGKEKEIKNFKYVIYSVGSSIIANKGKGAYYIADEASCYEILGDKSLASREVGKYIDGKGNIYSNDLIVDAYQKKDGNYIVATSDTSYVCDKNGKIISNALVSSYSGCDYYYSNNFVYFINEKGEYLTNKAYTDVNKFFKEYYVAKLVDGTTEVLTYKNGKMEVVDFDTDNLVQSFGVGRYLDNDLLLVAEITGSLSTGYDVTLSTIEGQEIFKFEKIYGYEVSRESNIISVNSQGDSDIITTFYKMSY